MNMNNQNPSSQIQEILPTLQGMMMTSDITLFEVSSKIYEFLQVVLEFMDKGVKGLLTGDLSVYII